MSELPDELRALLNMARDGHDPTDPEARVRVRSAVAASLLLSGGAVSSSAFPQAAASNSQTVGAALKASKLGWTVFGGKLSALALGAVTAAGLAVATYSYTRPVAVQPRRTPSATAAVAAVEQPLQAPPASEPVPAEQAAQIVDEPAPADATVSAGKPVRTHKPGAASLSAETVLLRAASEALARGDAPAALAQLREHAARFPQGSLREERDGLRAIAECSRVDAPSSASAKRFLRQYPGSLLGGRVRKACADR